MTAKMMTMMQCLKMMTVNDFDGNRWWKWWWVSLWDDDDGHVKDDELMNDSDNKVNDVELTCDNDTDWSW